MEMEDRVKALYEDGRHPLQNSVILKELFDLCPIKDLKNIRLVCKLWNHIALPRLRDKATVYVGPNIPSSAKRALLMLPRRITNDSCVNDLAALYSDRVAERPFRSYKIKYWTFSQETGNNHWCSLTTLNNFWINCGPWMRTLNLYRANIDCVKVFKTVIFRQTPCLEELTLFRISFLKSCECQKNDKDLVPGVQPNLKVLKVFLGSCPFPLRWADLLNVNRFPNLQSFTLNGLASVSEATTLLTALQLMNEDRKNLSIKSLDFSTFKTIGIVENLGPFLELEQFKLESLSINSTLYTDEEGLRITLTNQKNTLKTLKCHRDLDQLPFTNFPFGVQLNALTQLHLFGNVVSTMEFLLETPNLKALHINESPFDCNGRDYFHGPRVHNLDVMGSTNMKRMKGFVMGSLRVLSFVPKDPELVNEDRINILAEWFPNVNELAIPLKNETIHVVCKVWSNLETLNVHSVGINDKGITGLGGGMKEARLPNLTDLEGLTRLTVKEWTDMSSFKDDSIWKCFLEIPILQTLSVSLSAETSDEAYTALLKKFPSRFIVRHMPWPPAINHLQSMEKFYTDSGIA